MSQCLEDLLQQCTVKLTIPGVNYGTGFFISPGLILTCAHVVKDLGNKSIQVRWQSQDNWAQAVVERSILDPHDLAILRVVSRIDTNPPCVFLDGKIPRQRDPLYLFGYPDKDFPNGCPVTFDYEGLTGDAPALIKFKSGLVRPGMSGSPLLNQRTGDVCGIVKFTLDRSSVRGGGAIPTSVILNQFPELVEKQISFHQQDRRWNNLAGELFDDEKVMIQNNFDDTINYQVQTGANSNTFVGGVHNHNNDSPDGKLTVRKILMLSANPDNTDILRQRIEIKVIRDALKRSSHGNMFNLEDRLEANMQDVSEELSAINPYIVNISGRENGIEYLIFANGSDKNTGMETERIIADLFRLNSESVRCLVLNGCYSEQQAREIALHVDFIIGVCQKLEDEKVTLFINEFYYHLGAKRTIVNSYELGCNKLERIFAGCHILPVLLNKDDETRRKRLEEKLKSFETEIDKDKNNAQLWTEKANVLKNLGHLDSMEYKITTGEKTASDRSENYDRAVIAYDKALHLNNIDYKIWWEKGKILFELEKYSDAIQSYLKALELNPPSPNSYVICREYACILNKLQRRVESIILYKKSLEFEPKHRVSSYEKKQVYKKMYSKID